MKENFIREELIDLCIKYGMPITGKEDMETLEAYLNMAYEEDRLNKDIFEDEIFDVAEKVQGKGSKKFFSLSKS